MSRYFTFVIQNWRNGRDETMRWQVHCVRSEEEVRFPDASFVIRTWLDDDQQAIRGTIRHVQSGREMQFQSGRRAVEFVRAWIEAERGKSMEYDLAACEDDPPAPHDQGAREGPPHDQSV